jgi:DNA-binding NtrC family response regulator
MTRLLIVEDDRALRQMLSWELEELGYEVTAAASCGEAFTASESSDFELALLDYNLPDGVGTSVIRHLQHIHPGLPVVLCSGRDLSEVATDEIRQGGCLFISKPVKAWALHALFNRILSKGGKGDRFI